MSAEINSLVAVIENGLDRRYIDFSAPWFPSEGLEPTVYRTEIEGVPALVQLDVAKHGIQLVHWALMPKSGASFSSSKWPGEAWGSGYIDRRLSFSVGALEYHCRQPAKSLMAKFPTRSLDEVRLPVGWAA